MTIPFGFKPVLAINQDKVLYTDKGNRTCRTLNDTCQLLRSERWGSTHRCVWDKEEVFSCNDTSFLMITNSCPLGQD